MRRLLQISIVLAAATGVAAVILAQSQAGPPLPHKLVPDWAKLPAGWNFGECSGVAVDKQDNVWVFNRGAHPVIEFDKHGKMLQAWTETPVVSSHGIRVDSEGNVWAIDVKGNSVMKFTPSGRVLMVISQPRGKAGDNNTKDGFAEPTGVAFAPNGDFFISDGYVNSRVIKFTRGGDYVTHWGKKGTGDGEFNLVHDVALDKRGRLFVADRTNERIQIFDQGGKFIGKWTGIGSPWGLAYAANEDSFYVCDGVNDRVVRLNMEGQITGVLGSHGKTPGKFDFPHNIAVDSTGAIYVAEIKNWRVQKFVP